MTQAKTIFDLTVMMNLTKELTGLIADETSFLRRFKISDIKPIISRKQEIAHALDKQNSVLKANPSLLETLSAEEKLTLRALAESYDAAVQEYQVELFKAQKINGLLIKKITETVSDHVKINRGYNRSGTTNLNGTELARNTPAIKFNETI